MQIKNGIKRLILTYSLSVKYIDLISNQSIEFLENLIKNIPQKKPLDFSRGFWFNNVNSIDLFSNQMLEFLTHFVDNMP